jgi:hypothetical protein
VQVEGFIRLIPPKLDLALAKAKIQPQISRIIANDLRNSRKFV